VCVCVCVPLSSLPLVSYRGFKGRRRALVFRKNVRARRVNMAGVIRRTWLSYCAKRKVRRIKEVHEVKEAWATRKWLKDEGGYIREDMDSVQVRSVVMDLLPCSEHACR
jgi:hypothetical protein